MSETSGAANGDWDSERPFSETPHDPFARECVVHGLPSWELHDRPCPACREIGALIDLDPDFGSRDDGRPFIGTTPEGAGA